MTTPMLRSRQNLGRQDGQADVEVTQGLAQGELGTVNYCGAMSKRGMTPVQDAGNHKSQITRPRTGVRLADGSRLTAYGMSRLTRSPARLDLEAAEWKAEKGVSATVRKWERKVFK